VSHASLKVGETTTSITFFFYYFYKDINTSKTKW
jgi:hypothetical protein